MRADVLVVDWGGCNIGSVVNAVRLAGGVAEVSAQPERIADARRLILPGVASFDTAAEGIDRLGLRDILRHKAVEDRIPVLGICLGMQMLFAASDEGHGCGLNWLPGHVIRFDAVRAPGLRLPHIGWNALENVGHCPLLDGLSATSRFYFVHSYHLDGTANPAAVRACCTHGYSFPAVVQSGRIFGVQFHPEKSQQAGLRLIANFLHVDRP